MYCNPNSCATAEKVNPPENGLNSCSSREDPIFSHTSDKLIWCLQLEVPRGCKVHAATADTGRTAVGQGEVSKQGRDLTLSCTKETCAATVMCPPDMKALLTSLTSFPRLSLKASTVSDRSRKEELKESRLCRKREKETRSHYRAQTKKLNSCKHSCKEE